MTEFDRGAYNYAVAHQYMFDQIRHGTRFDLFGKTFWVAVDGQRQIEVACVTDGNTALQATPDGGCYRTFWASLHDGVWDERVGYHVNLIEALATRYMGLMPMDPIPTRPL
jgi:hypothetical protein